MYKSSGSRLGRGSPGPQRLDPHPLSKTVTAKGPTSIESHQEAAQLSKTVSALPNNAPTPELMNTVSEQKDSQGEMITNDDNTNCRKEGEK